MFKFFYTITTQKQDLLKIIYLTEDYIQVFQTGLKDASLNLDNDEIEDEDDYEDTDHEEDKGIKSSKQKKEDEGRNDGFTENIIDQSTKSKQSSFGITFITHENELIKVKYGFSKYDKQKKNNKSCFQQKKFIDEIKVEIDLSKKIQVINQDLLNETSIQTLFEAPDKQYLNLIKFYQL